MRYKNEAGTPDRVKIENKSHFQVRRVLAYVLGDPKIIRQIDARAKLLSVKNISGFIDRPGKTEFRIYSSKDECLNQFAMLAEQNGLTISRPVFDTIAWDYLIGAGSISPQNWVVKKHSEYKKLQKQETIATEGKMAAFHNTSGKQQFKEKKAEKCFNRWKDDVGDSENIVNALRKEDCRNPGVSEVLQQAKEVFKDIEKVTLWMHSPNRALGGRAPLEVIQSGDGIDVILDELGRIKHGIPI